MDTFFFLDGSRVSAPAGTTILDAARSAGVEIPTLCNRPSFTPSGSCLVCLVLDVDSGRMVPACASAVREGMRVEASTPPVLEARKRSLELLLSEHLGDCEAPCVRACPGGVDIPRMIRLIADGRPEEAAAVIAERVALPASLSWICSSPCEGACRRTRIDGPLSICFLKRYASRAGLAGGLAEKLRRAGGSGRATAVVGAGPAGLTAAWFLLLAGHACTVIEAAREPGGVLRSPSGKGPPLEILERELDSLRKLGADIVVGTELGRDVDLDDIAKQFDAVLLAAGAVGGATLLHRYDAWGIETTESGVAADPRTLLTSRHGVFAAGSIVRPRRHPAVDAARGRAAAKAVHRFLSGQGAAEGRRRFSSIIGSLLEGEGKEFLKGADGSPPVRPADGMVYTAGEAEREAKRCLHCDCRKREACRLREEADRAGAVQRRFAGEGRTPFRQVLDHPEIVFEPGKCIRCGLCLQAAAAAGADPGLFFSGKGADMEVGIPFGASLAKSLSGCWRECATVCPTGAFSIRD